MNVLAAASVTLAGVGLTYGSRRFARQLSAWLPAYAEGAITLLLPVAVFVSVVALAGRATRSFDPGLIAAALVGVAFIAAARRVPGEPSAAPALTRGEHVRFDLALLVVAALYGYVAWRYQMHDEHSIFGHKSMVEQLRYGDYPIALPPIPTQDARYHYGFDILAGALARAYGLSADMAIDLVTVALAVMISWVSAALVSDLGGRRSAPFAAIAIHLGAGLAWLMLAGVSDRHPRCLLQYHHPSCGVELFPTPFLNVFQHPVSLGVPLLFGFLIVAKRLLEGSGPRWQWAATAVAILPALALGQVVYFVLGVLAVLSAVALHWLWYAGVDDRDLVGGVVDARRPALGRWSAVRQSLPLIAVIAAGVGLAVLAGGMFTPSPVTDPNLIAFRSGVGFPPGEPPLQVLRHHAINLGVGFVLLPYFAWRALFARRFLLAVLVAFAIGGILVPHGWTYVRSWDIVKFPSAAAFALTIVYLVLVDAPLAGGGLLARWLRRAGATSLIGSGVVAATFVTFPLQAKHLLYSTTPWRVDPLIGQAIDWWRGHGYQREQLIYTQSNIASQLAVFGGLSVVGGDYDFSALGIHAKVLGEQRQLQGRIKATMDRDALSQLGVRWVMLSTEELDNLGLTAMAALLDADGGRFTVVATFEAPNPRQSRRIWRVEAGALRGQPEGVGSSAEEE